MIQRRDWFSSTFLSCVIRMNNRFAKKKFTEPAFWGKSDQKTTKSIPYGREQIKRSSKKCQISNKSPEVYKIMNKVLSTDNDHLIKPISAQKLHWNCCTQNCFWQPKQTTYSEWRMRDITFPRSKKPRSVWAHGCRKIRDKRHVGISQTKTAHNRDGALAWTHKLFLRWTRARRAIRIDNTLLRRIIIDWMLLGNNVDTAIKSER